MGREWAAVSYNRVGRNYNGGEGTRNIQRPDLAGGLLQEARPRGPGWCGGHSARCARCPRRSSRRRPDSRAGQAAPSCPAAVAWARPMPASGQAPAACHDPTVWPYRRALGACVKMSSCRMRRSVRRSSSSRLRTAAREPSTCRASAMPTDRTWGEESRGGEGRRQRIFGGCSPGQPRRASLPGAVLTTPSSSSCLALCSAHRCHAMAAGPLAPAGSAQSHSTGGSTLTTAPSTKKKKRGTLRTLYRRATCGMGGDQQVGKPVVSPAEYSKLASRLVRHLLGGPPRLATLAHGPCLLQPAALQPPHTALLQCAPGRGGRAALAGGAYARLHTRLLKETASWPRRITQISAQASAPAARSAAPA